MRIANRRNVCFIAMLLLLVVLSACSPRPEFVVYEGPPLSIAVIGEAPDVKEEHVIFDEFAIGDLKNPEISLYDAVIIREDQLDEASEIQYWDVYTNSVVSFFFMDVVSDMPFVVKDIGFDEEWRWKKGSSYAVGVLDQKDDTHKTWHYGLYNDQKTEEHIQDVYSRIFQTVDELVRNR